MSLAVRPEMRHDSAKPGSLTHSPGGGGVVKVEVAEAEAEITVVKSEVAEVEAEITVVKSEVAEVEAEITVVKPEVADVGRDVVEDPRERADVPLLCSFFFCLFFLERLLPSKVDKVDASGLISSPEENAHGSSSLRAIKVAKLLARPRATEPLL